MLSTKITESETCVCHCSQTAVAKRLYALTSNPNTKGVLQRRTDVLDVETRCTNLYFDTIDAIRENLCIRGWRRAIFAHTLFYPK